MNGEHEPGADESGELPDDGRDRIDPGPVADRDEFPADFAFLYSADELAEIDRRRIAPPEPGAAGTADAEADADADVVDAPAPAGRVRRLGASGAVLAGVMLGVGEALEPDREKQSIIEFAPDKVAEDEQLVTFHMVPGDPRASRLVIRPWLLDHFRAARAAQVAAREAAEPSAHAHDGGARPDRGSDPEHLG